MPNPHSIAVRYAASFSNTQEPDWRVRGDPALGPGTYAVERAEAITLPAPQGGAGDADPARPSLPFCVRRTSFDTQHLAEGYRTLKPRFATPRCPLYASEPPGGAPAPPAADASVATSAAERTAGELIYRGRRERRRLSPAAKVRVCCTPSRTLSPTSRAKGYPISPMDPSADYYFFPLQWHMS